MREYDAESVRSKDTQELPVALRQWLTQGWRSEWDRADLEFKIPPQCAGRRRALCERFPGRALVIPNGFEKVRSNDMRFRFRPSSEFIYLIGDGEPGDVAVCVPHPGAVHETILFTAPGTDYSTSDFFTDHQKGAIWVGPSRGIRASETALGVTVKPIHELEPSLRALQGAGVVRGIDPTVDALVTPVQETDTRLLSTIAELRLIKDDGEVSALAEACRVTVCGFHDIVRALPTIGSEREVEAIFQKRAIADGGDIGYTPIAAAGAHSTVLHWTRRDGRLRAGELLLVDAGAETASHYTADVTRTWPIDGRFTPPQRAIYDLIWQAHQAALRVVRPGVDFLAPHRAAMAVIAEGLCRLGVLKVAAERALADDQQLYRRYTVHSVSHMLGLDVHDCSHARPEVSVRGRLAEGMVLTVEPGVYFQPNDATVPAEYRGIGVRIEDDVVVTQRGCRILSVGLSVEAEAVEDWMTRMWSSAS